MQLLYIQEMRLKSWLKNVIVFVPIVFALELMNPEKLFATVIAFFAFCLVSSAVYVYNDICDADKDAIHPTKCTRPVASGAITKPKAVVFAVLLAVSGLAICLLGAKWEACVLIAFYLGLNILYTLSLKHKPIVDCFCIAAGFVLRIYVGGVACGETVSDWLFLTIAAMALFMAFGKRRGELTKVGDNSTRVVLERYDMGFLNGMMFTCAGMSVVFYALWAMYRGNNVVFTVPLVIFIVAKYLSLLYDKNSHGDPTTVIYSSKSLLLACVLYAVLIVVLLYMG